MTALPTATSRVLPTTLAGVHRMINAEWSRINAASRCHTFRVPKRPKLLGSSHKVELGSKLGVWTAVLYLAPADESGRNVCAWATESIIGTGGTRVDGGCKDTCLATTPDEDGVGGTGRMYVNADHCANARGWKTALYFGDRELFFALLGMELAAHERKASKLGKIAAVRLDGSSDLGIGRKVAPSFPGVRFYDYSKSVTRALRNARGGDVGNYHVTFSHSGRNVEECRTVLAAGGNVAVAFDVEPCAAWNGLKPGVLPASWLDAPVLDGDVSDVRFADPSGHVVGLRFKGSPSTRTAWELARAAAGSFVVAVSDDLAVAA